MVLSFDTPDDWPAHEKIADLIERQVLEWKGAYAQERALSALRNIIGQLDARGDIDMSRIAITGLSFGAQTLDYALVHSTLFAVAISSGSFTSPINYFIAHAPILKKYYVAACGSPENPQYLRCWGKFSIGLNAKCIATPLLINVADRELVAAMFNYTALKDAGAAVEMHVFPDEYHVKWHPQHRLAIYQRNLQWLSFWLRSEEGASPVDGRQYERWREMRRTSNKNRCE
jgi:dipeptidyl aminopeptidase/acylaminoacyl peptidase